MMERVWVTLATNFVKTLIVSFLLMMVFNRLVVRRLALLTHLIRSQSWQAPTAAIVPEGASSRSTGFDAEDEIGELLHNYADASREVAAAADESRKKIEQQQAQIANEKAKAAAAARLAELSTMAGGLAHEINNPLTVITSACSLLSQLSQSDRLSQDRTKDLLDRVTISAERIAKITNSLLAVSRDGSKEKMSRVSINEILDDVRNISEFFLKKRGIDLVIEPAGERDTMECRPVQISQVLVNLINNSADAIRGLETRWIRVSTSTSESQITIRVTDSGGGIAPDIAEKLFLPFFTTKPVGHGTGLGLSIAHEVVADHNGTIELNRSCPNTQFVVKLNRAA